MSHLNLPKRIHEPHKVKWVQGEVNFTMFVDDRFDFMFPKEEEDALKKTMRKASAKMYFAEDLINI